MSERLVLQQYVIEKDLIENIANTFLFSVNFICLQSTTQITKETAEHGNNSVMQRESHWPVTLCSSKININPQRRFN